MFNDQIQWKTKITGDNAALSLEHMSFQQRSKKPTFEWVVWIIIALIQDFQQEMPSCRIFQSNSTIKSSLNIWVSLYIEILDAKSRNSSGIVFWGSTIRQILDYDVFGRHLRLYLFAFLSIEGSKHKVDRTHYTRWPSNALQEMSTSLNFATMTNNKWAWAKRKWFTIPFSYLSVILESPGFLSSGQWRFASCIKTKQRVIL